MRIVATITATLTALAGLVVAGPASGALVSPTITLYSSRITVQTHNGQAWKLDVAALPNNSVYQLRESLQRSRSRPVPTTEYHQWYDDIPASSLTFDTTSGNGTLTTPSSVAALTTLNLTFTTTSRHDRVCSSGSETDYFGDLSGRVTLHTQVKPGGTVGGQHVSFPAGKSEIIADSDCQVATLIGPCRTGTEFQTFGSGHHELYGFEPKGYVQLSHDVGLVSPAGARRYDEFTTRSARTPVYNSRKHILQIWASDTGPFTGTGRFFGGKLAKYAGNCSHNGVAYTAYIREFDNPAFRNGVNQPLVAHTSLVGKMTEPNTNHGYYDFETWK